MKGKKADASERRRQMEALEKRAETAERRVPQLEKELTELREQADRQIAGLRRELATALKQRDESAAPAIAELEEQNRLLRVERDKAVASAKTSKRFHHRAIGHYHSLLVATGLTRLEAMEVMAATVGTMNPESVIVNEGSGVGGKRAAKLPAGAAERIQAATGNRGNGDLKAHLIATLNGDDVAEGA